MSGPGSLRRLERRITTIRVLLLVYGAIQILYDPVFPDRMTERLGWVFLGMLGTATLAIWGVVRQSTDERSLGLIGRSAFAFDLSMTCVLVWVTVAEDPYVTWAVLLLLPVEGALRYRVKGAAIATLVVAVFFFVHTLRVADLNNAGFDLSTYSFVVALCALIGGIVGSMLEGWNARGRSLEEQNARLVEIDRLRDRYVAVTSHEIRGPLSAIITGVDTIRKREDKITQEKRRHLLDMVLSQGRQLARLVDDLMIGSELEAGELKMSPEWTELEGPMKEALDAAAPKRRSHLLEVFVEPIQCEIDPYRISQLVRNLVENAYKYTPDRSKVTVAGKAIRDGISISVSDDGPGIPPEKRDQLFEAFSRIDETAAGKAGVGLGLYVVSQLVNAMNGSIDLESSTRGTTFNIRIPCERAALEGRHIGLVPDESDVI